jgi:hypothetical protein
MHIDPQGLKLTIVGDDKFKAAATRNLKEVCTKVRVDAKGSVSVADPPYDKVERRACCCMLELTSNKWLNEIRISWYVPYATPENRSKAVWARPPVSGSKGRTERAGPGSAGTVRWSPILQRWEREKVDDAFRFVPKAMTLAHELCGHILYYNIGTHWVRPDDETGGMPISEKAAVDIENVIREQRGMWKRTTYGKEGLEGHQVVAEEGYPEPEEDEKREPIPWKEPKDEPIDIPRWRPPVNIIEDPPLRVEPRLQPETEPSLPPGGFGRAKKTKEEK